MFQYKTKIKPKRVCNWRYNAAKVQCTSDQAAVEDEILLILHFQGQSHRHKSSLAGVTDSYVTVS